MTTRAVITTLIAAVALVLVGCGGSKPLSKAEYRQKINTYGDTFKNDVAASRSKLQAATDRDGKAAGVGEFKDEFSKLASQLDGIEPPKNAKSAHDALVSTLRKGADDLGKLQEAVKAGDQAKVREGALALQKDNVEVQTEIQQLKSAVGS
jgi:hypothetical protein